MSDSFKYIDLSYLEGIAEGDTDIIKELVEIFLDQMPEFAEGFLEHMKDKNWLKVAAVAHKAKSSVMSMGMQELGNVDLKNLELLAKQMRIEELKKKDIKTEAQEEEIKMLERNFEGYPENRINWIKSNVSVDVLNELIDKFNDMCLKAVDELNEVISTY